MGVQYYLSAGTAVGVAGDYRVVVPELAVPGGDIHKSVRELHHFDEHLGKLQYLGKENVDALMNNGMEMQPTVLKQYSI